MRAVIIGGGKVGYYLLKTLKEKGYSVTLIESNSHICEQIAEELDAEVLCGDGTDIDVLKDADIEEADVVAAVTGKDEENLVICQIIKVYFNNRETIARINNPKNRQVFKELGINKTVCGTEIISNLIESEFNKKELKVIQTLDRGEMILIEATITSRSNFKNKLISNLGLPDGCIIVSLFRGDKVIHPKGNIEIKEDDRVFIVSNIKKKMELEKCIIGGLK